MTACTECGEVLADEPLPVPAPAPPRVHGTAEVSLVGIGQDDRTLLEMLRRGEDIPAEWRAGA